MTPSSNGRFVTLYLPEISAGRILDGLHQTMIIWRATAEYLDCGYTTLADCIEECADSNEATAVADFYQYVIASIQTQLNNQCKPPP